MATSTRIRKPADLTPRRPADGVQGLDVREAAYLLGCHPHSVRNAIARGDLPHARLGRRVIVPRSAVERLLAGTAA